MRINGELEFPRLTDRGLIEVSSSTARRAVLPPFPRLTDRGLIEVRIQQQAASDGTHVSAIKQIAASLKLFTGRIS